MASLPYLGVNKAERKHGRTQLYLQSYFLEMTQERKAVGLRVPAIPTEPALEMEIAFKEGMPAPLFLSS